MNEKPSINSADINIHFLIVITGDDIHFSLVNTIRRFRKLFCKILFIQKYRSIKDRFHVISSRIMYFRKYKGTKIVYRNIIFTTTNLIVEGFSIYKVS